MKIKPKKHREIICATLEDVAGSVIVNGISVYHDDDDKGYCNDNFSVEEVAKRLSMALGVPRRVVRLKFKDFPNNGEEWNHDDIVEIALRKLRA